MDFVKSSEKKLYEMVLGAKEPCETLENALEQLVRMSIDDPANFDFLIHRVSWFDEPLCSYRALLIRMLRLFRAIGKDSAYVAYTFIAEHMSTPENEHFATTCLLELASNQSPNQVLIKALKDAYPHKTLPIEMHVCYLNGLLSLAATKPHLRHDILEIVLENLISFDTEIPNFNSGSQHILEDSIESVEHTESTPIALKLDILQEKLMEFLLNHKKDTKLMQELFSVFQDHLLPVKSTQCLQFTIYALAESSKEASNQLISLLIDNILDTNQRENHYRIYTQSHFYLTSYLARSTSVSPTKIAKIIPILVGALNELLRDLKPPDLNPELVAQEFRRIERPLHLLQTILKLRRLADSHIDLTDLLKNCDKILCYRHFLAADFVKASGLQCENSSSSYILKYSHKFMMLPLKICRHRFIEHNFKDYKPSLSFCSKRVKIGSICSEETG